MNNNFEKTLDRKLARIAADSSCRDFILADAKDADMAFGLAATGKTLDGKMRSLDEYRQMIRQNVEQALVDIMLMSPSTGEILTLHERIFDGSPVTAACRANDATDIHLGAGGAYGQSPSRPFRNTTIDQIMYGKVDPRPGEPVVGANLGLYSVTFNNDVERDLETLQAYRAFRIEAESKGLRHFMEVFDPNACGQVCPPDLGRFLNDQIARTLAGVVGKSRPVFLKIPYHGPEAMEALVAYDSHLVIGILGGASGTTFDAYHQLWEARKYGARAALYGRMINHSEHQPSMIQHLRWLADGDADDPAEAVRSYHGALQKLEIQPFRSLEEDLVPTRRGSAYSAAKSSGVAASSVRPASASGGLDKVKASLARWQNVLG